MSGGIALISTVLATRVVPWRPVKSIAGAATDGDTVRLAPVLIQPMAADDVATAVGRIAVSAP